MMEVKNNRKETEAGVSLQEETVAIRASKYSYEELIEMGIPESDACRMKKIPYQPT